MKVLEFLNEHVIMPEKNAREAYMDTYADFGGNVGKIYDYQIADYASKHIRFIDRFSMRKMAHAMMMSFDILNGALEEPKCDKKNWKFFVDV